MSRLKKHISLLLVVVMVLAVLPVGASAADVNAVYQAELGADETGSSTGTWNFKWWVSPLNNEPYTVSVDARVVGAETGKFRFFTTCGDPIAYTDWELTSEWQTFSVEVTPTWGGIDLGVGSAGTACTVEFDNLKIVKGDDIVYSNEDARKDGPGDSRYPSVVEYLLDNKVLKVGGQEAVSVTQSSGLNMIPGDEYTLTYWVKGEGTVTVSTCEDGPEGSSVTPTADSSWKKVKSVFVAGETDTGAIVPTVTSVPGSGTVYVDHISIMDWNGTEFVTNGDFQNGLEGWTGGTLAEVKDWPDVPVTTNHVLHMAADTYAQTHEEYIDGLPAGTYTVSFIARGSGSLDVAMKVDYVIAGQVTAPLTSEWTKYEGVITTTGTPVLTIVMSEGGNAWIDDIQIRDAAGVIYAQYSFDNVGVGSGSCPASYLKYGLGNGWTENIQNYQSSNAQFSTFKAIEQDCEIAGGMVENSVLEVRNRPSSENLYLAYGGNADGHYGKKYNLSVWVKGPATGPMARVRVTFGDWGNNEAGGNVAVTAEDYWPSDDSHMQWIVEPGKWTHITTEFTSIQGWCLPAFYVEWLSETVDGEVQRVEAYAYFDDFTVTDEDGNQVVGNGTFETGLDGWWTNLGNGWDYFHAVKMAPHGDSEKPSEPANYLDVSEYRSGDAFTAPTEEGKVFAGWYTDAEFTTPLEETVTTGKAYAKFVDAAVLSVKWQIAAGTTAESETTNLRMLTSVDSLDYSEVGFTVEFDGQTRIKTTNTVYRLITGYTDEGGVKYQPTIFSEESQYFMSHTMKNVPNSAFGTEILVTPKWTTLDGTVVTGTPSAVVINTSFQ